MDRKERLLVGLLVFVLVVFYAVRTQAEERDVQERGVVKRVVDGDTFMVVLGKKEVRVRMVGINAPEVKSNDCFAGEATNALQSLVEGKKVLLERDQRNKDEYGRLLRYVSIQGYDVNKMLVEQGFAHALLDFPFEKSKQYKQAEDVAKKSGKGLWKECIN